MLQNAYFLAKIGADTSENEQHFAQILPKLGNYPTGPPGRCSARREVENGKENGDVRSGVDVRERRLAKFRQNVARFRLYRLRFLQENMRFAAFFKIYQILKLTFLKFGKFCRFSSIYKIVAEFARKLLIFETDFWLKC